ncbi:uncharacterized protein J4E79_010653 [Alternaria viburni]|uniref:uncharacterized protein n=1 Tax=Alternaria viburni TaxID=566460 RepID=UPI0020C5B1C7|nr:uncharacterized protein J4E79_010653 [Alternaria viburni]KAI4646144.1 hypothetical protein J4E79_010653 [Alternaria viburni]
MNPYETIMWEKEMKELILSHARAVYGEMYRQGTVFDVVHSTCATTYDMDRAELLSYDINLVVYFPQDTLLSWKVLRSCYSGVTAADGLNALLESLKFSLQIRISEKAQAEKIVAVIMERETAKSE